MALVGLAVAAEPEWLALCAKCVKPAVTSKSGIGTANAVAEAKVTQAGAKEWCENWQPADNIGACVRDQLTEHGSKIYRANADCLHGQITPVDGKTYTLAGFWTSGDGKGRTKWRGATGTVMGQDNTSGGLSISQQWEVLCSSTIK
jgi:hypothetical protein